MYIFFQLLIYCFLWLYIFEEIFIYCNIYYHIRPVRRTGRRSSQSYPSSFLTHHHPQEQHKQQLIVSLSSLRLKIFNLHLSNLLIMLLRWFIAVVAQLAFGKSIVR